MRFKPASLYFLKRNMVIQGYPNPPLREANFKLVGYCWNLKSSWYGHFFGSAKKSAFSINFCNHHKLESCGTNWIVAFSQFPTYWFYEVHFDLKNLPQFIFFTKLIIQNLSQYAANVMIKESHDFGSPALNTLFIYVEFVLVVIGFTPFLMLRWRTGVLEPGIHRVQGLADVASNSASSIVCCFHSRHNQIQFTFQFFSVWLALMYA